MAQLLVLVLAFAAGFALWGLFEYLLHRFAMHELHGRGIMSREHLEHHVAAGWTFSTTHLLSWAGMLLVGFVAWMPIGWALVGFGFGVAVAIGWAVGYFFYEYEHMASHRKAPRTRYQRWLRKHHFHHHFGHPMSNHGVTVPWWDRVFGTLETPERVRVPRRMAQPWMLGPDGELRPEHRDDYELVGTLDRTERLAQLDRARAFASIAPED
ncbi:MAG: sterol desaturase family protein [Acidimicrobiales bacterium]|nr:sterol desaturase family protein [Acidimicrobiales bacterium]HRW39568.1 sterol desaturase family protein [Aquihabitans sp.]